ncbi:MAG: apolipoprotein N-acyltransferase [Gammaproteobacteria bacterium]|nr:apolipoprotein N-acyltransferase [Gammaproteobacteria bacterium]
MPRSLDSTPWQLIVALLAGLMMPLAHAPFAISPLAILSLAALFILWTRVTVRRALLLGYVYGAGMFGAGVSWVFVSIYGHGGVPLLLSVVLTVMFVLFLALFPAVVGAACAALVRGAPPQVFAYILILAPAALWVLGEWVRGWLLTGFPWLVTGYSQIDTPLSGLAPLLGVYGVSLAVGLSAATLSLLSWPHLRRQRPALIMMAIVAATWALGMVAGSYQWGEASGDPVRVSLVQGNISQDVKWLPAIRELTLERYVTMTRQQPDSQLIVWPETAIPAYYHEARPFLDWMHANLVPEGGAILTGLIYKEPGSGAYYNTVLGLGSTEQFYHKHHLVPFTEYLPLKGVLGSLIDVMDVPMSDFSAGAVTQRPLAVAGQHIGVSICFEDAFGEEGIRQLPEATLLVNVSNDAWFDRSAAPQQHLQMARMRALETARPLLRATNTGMTAIIDARGRLQQVAPQFAEAVLSGEIQPRQGATPYVIMGNYPAVTGAGLMLALVVVLRRRGRTQSPADSPSC